MNKKEIIKDLYDMLYSITGRKIDIDDLDLSLFGKEYNLKPRDVVYLLLQIEDKYELTFGEKFIIDYHSFTLSSITEMIYEEFH